MGGLLDEESVRRAVRSSRFRALGRRSQPLPHIGKVVFSLGWLGLNLGALVVGGFFSRGDHPMSLNHAYLLGLQRFTASHLSFEPAIEFILLGVSAACVRVLWLVYRVVFSGGPIEVRQIDDASGQQDVDVHQLNVAFREYLTLPRLYQVTSIPGDREPEDFISMFDVPSSSGWRGMFAAVLTYAFPKRAFIVSAALRHRETAPRFGVSVQVRTLLGPVAELETQWSLSFERALERAAYAVGAYILPQTRRAYNAPWAGWVGRELPVSLFRNYQRAKRMVSERRYDEALGLYRQALVEDAGNIAFRYDVGQLFERLSLYPDALNVYLPLVNAIFPPYRPRRPWRSKHLRRRAKPLWRAQNRRDPFIIRYRYVVSLSVGRRMAEELTRPRWPEAREWLNGQTQASPQQVAELRPWRVPELRDLQHNLSHQLERLFPEISAKLQPGGPYAGHHTLQSLVVEAGKEGAALEPVERYLLECAKIEAELLIADFSRWRLRGLRQLRRLLVLLRLRRPGSAVTVTAMRILQECARYRLDQLTSPESFTDDGCHKLHLTEPQIANRLKQCHFNSRTSVSWLEHYNAACFYAMMLADDLTEDPRHQQYAYAAVKHLERALELGDEIAFVRTKRYWLQAGDPDLAGLRGYAVFRAFEARTYGVVYGEGMELAKYELYVHLRELLKLGASQLENVWRERAAAVLNKDRRLDLDNVEDWWIREEQAWEIVIRLGRFYRQWQTREAVLAALRNWVQSFGLDVRSVPYPNLSRIDYIPNPVELTDVQTVLRHTEDMLMDLGTRCGNLRGSGTADDASIVGKTRNWRQYAEAVSRLPVASDPDRLVIARACIARAGLWAALRQWASTPDKSHRADFLAAMKAVPVPPRLPVRRTHRILSHLMQRL